MGFIPSSIQLDVAIISLPFVLKNIKLLFTDRLRGKLLEVGL